MALFSTEAIRIRSNEATTKKKNVVVALSGGVDSSVVAASLRESIRACVHMTNWNPHEHQVEGCAAPATTTTTSTPSPAKAAAITTPAPACSGASDHADAQAVARHLNVPLHHVEFQAQYYQNVFE
jgi:tRNA U34 2-thiouridine synthase MnmA/TrmU